MTVGLRRRVSILALVLTVTLGMVQSGLFSARPAAAADLLLVINQILTDGFPEVAVYFTFTDAAGLPITDVSKDRVQVVHNGTPVPELTLELAESEQDGVAVVVAVDTSGSMEGEPLEYARGAIRQFLEKMGPQDRGAIVAFGQDVQVIQEMTGDRQVLSRALDTLQAKGDTKIYDGVFEAVSMVAQEPLGRRAVIVISDGEDTHSTFTLDDVVAKARETSTPVSAIAIGQFLLDPLRRLTQTTGGSLGEAPAPERLAERTQQFSELLRKQYVLRYRAPDTRPPENEVEIKVSQSGQQVQAAQRFPAPPMPLAVTLPALQPGSTVSGQVELQPALENAERVDRVEYLLDGAPLGAVTELPYRFTWNSADAPPGEHTLTIRAHLGEHVAEQTVPLVVAAASAPSPAPEVVAQASPSPGATAGVVAQATPTVAATRTPPPTSTPTEEGLFGVEGLPTLDELTDLDKALPYLLIGFAVILVLVGAVIFALVRRSSRAAAPPFNATPDTSPLGRGLPGGPQPGGPQQGYPGPSSGFAGPGGPGAPPAGPADPQTAEYEPLTRQAKAFDPSSSERPTSEHATIDSAALQQDDSEARTVMFDAPATGQAPVAGPPAPGRPPPTARLTVRVAGQPEETVRLGPDQIIGRLAAPGVIVVADTRVSRRHARISWENGHFVYRDFAPTNPTRRDGRTIPNPCVLLDGDRLAVGTSEIILHL